MQKEVQERKLIAARGGNTQKIDQSLQNSQLQLEELLSGIGKRLDLLQADPDKYQVTEQEVKVRSNLFLDLSQRRNALTKQIKELSQQAKSARAGQFGVSQYAALNGGSNLDNMSSIELQQLKTRKYQEQDEQIDGITEIIKKVNKDQREIHEIIVQDNERLGDQEDKIDKVNAQMLVAKSQMENLLAQTNTCCLWCVIIIQLFIFIFLISL